MDILIYSLFFIYGASIGSFVQLVVTRLNVAPITRSRSKCLSCGETLTTFDLIPVFSYLLHRGKCAYCKIPYGKDSILVEVGFGILFILLYLFFLKGSSFFIALVWGLYYSLLFISLGVIALYDYKHSYVPTFFLILFSFLSFGMLGVRYLYDPGISVALGPFVVGLPFLLVWLASKGRGVGFGDVILFVAIGAFFGIEQGLAVLLLAIWIGAIVGVGVYLYRRHRHNKNTAIPFVPFIVIAFLIVLFTDTTIFSIAYSFS